jgi:hypothetical protein
MERASNDLPRPADPLPLADAVAMVAGDLPIMTEAQLAGILLEIHYGDSSPLGAALEPLVRMELRRRRTLAMLSQRRIVV